MRNVSRLTEWLCSVQANSISRDGPCDLRTTLSARCSLYNSSQTVATQYRYHFCSLTKATLTFNYTGLASHDVKCKLEIGERPGEPKVGISFPMDSSSPWLAAVSSLLSLLMHYVDQLHSLLPSLICMLRPL